MQHYSSAHGKWLCHDWLTTDDASVRCCLEWTPITFHVNALPLAPLYLHKSRAVHNSLELNLYFITPALFHILPGVPQDSTTNIVCTHPLGLFGRYVSVQYVKPNGPDLLEHLTLCEVSEVWAQWDRVHVMMYLIH